MTEPGWVAEFRDGPAAGGPAHVFFVGDPWQEIRLAPMPDPHGWTIVGGDGIPDPDIPHRQLEPWDGETTYRLADIVAVSGARIAFYEQDAP